MNERISRLMDGEADASEIDGLCELAKSDGAMETWNCYHTIGDALRGEPAVTRNVGSAVARQLASEPTVLAPRAPLLARRRTSWLASCLVAGTSPPAGHIDRRWPPATGPRRALSRRRRAHLA